MVTIQPRNTKVKNKERESLKMKLIERIKRYLENKKEERKIRNYFKNLEYMEYKSEDDVIPPDNDYELDLPPRFEENKKENDIDTRSIRKLADEKNKKREDGKKYIIVSIDTKNGYGYRYESELI